MARKTMSLFLTLGLALLVPFAAQATHARAGDVRRVAGAIPGRFIVTLRGAPANDAPAAAVELAAHYGGTISHVYTAALRGFSVTMSPRAAARLAADSRVALVEQDGVVHAITTQNAPPYGLDRIDQHNLPLNNTYTYNATGSGVRAYVIDTGIRVTHGDFGGRASVGTDTVNDGRNGIDCNGHGTHVSGTIGGASYGVAKQVSLVAVRVLGCDGSGATSSVIAGVDWVTAHRVRPAVANMSLGGGASTSLDNAVSNSINSGVVYAIAAGNGNVLGMAQDACSTSPARVAAAITVSATDSSDTKASFANTGTCVDIFAPGVNVTSDWNSSDTSTNTISGTSMATPHVAGAAALYLQGNPTSVPSVVGSALNGNATPGVVESPGTGSPNRLLYTGFIGGGGGGNNPPSASFTSSCSALTCSFIDTSTDADGSIASRSWSFGDGSTSTATNPSHTYAEAGSYAVSLTVTDNGGASSVSSQTVSVASSVDPDPGTPTLANGVASTRTNGATGTWQYFKIQVPSGKSSLAVTLSGTQMCGLLSCSPDLDLYVRRATKPTTSTYTCAGTTGSSNESCTLSNPAADWWYLGVYVYDGANARSFSIKATY
ncbi:MAG: S8 family serine peptidase [Actinomycetota bacterium]